MNSRTSLKDRQTSELSKCYKQFMLLNWKNLILLKRNYFQTLFELTLSVFFVFTLLIIRHIVENIYVQAQPNTAYNIIDYFFVYAGHDLVLFYPNTPIVEQIVTHAYDILRARKNWIPLTG